MKFRHFFFFAGIFFFPDFVGSVLSVFFDVTHIFICVAFFCFFFFLLWRLVPFFSSWIQIFFFAWARRRRRPGSISGLSASDRAAQRLGPSGNDPSRSSSLAELVGVTPLRTLAALLRRLRECSAGLRPPSSGLRFASPRRKRRGNGSFKEEEGKRRGWRFRVLRFSCAAAHRIRRRYSRKYRGNTSIFWYYLR